jgi:hypothetical protein
MSYPPASAYGSFATYGTCDGPACSSSRLTIVGGVRERLVVTRRGRRKTVCARGAWSALLGGPSTSPLGRPLSEALLTPNDVLAACERALKLAPASYPPTLPASKELLGAPDWHPFEQAAWPIGEAVRQALSRHPKLKKDDALVAKVTEVATCRNLRRGRQSFILALGFVGARSHAATLATLLEDPDGYAEMTTPRKPGRLSRSRSLLLPEQQAEWAVS